MEDLWIETISSMYEFNTMLPSFRSSTQSSQTSSGRTSSKAFSKEEMMQQRSTTSSSKWLQTSTTLSRTLSISIQVREVVLSTCWMLAPRKERGLKMLDQSTCYTRRWESSSTARTCYLLNHHLERDSSTTIRPMKTTKKSLWERCHQFNNTDKVIRFKVKSSPSTTILLSTHWFRTRRWYDPTLTWYDLNLNFKPLILTKWYFITLKSIYSSLLPIWNSSLQLRLRIHIPNFYICFLFNFRVDMVD